jgi:hypothetical protein
VNFELQVAIRYLQAKRKQAVISIITVIFDSWCHCRSGRVGNRLLRSMQVFVLPSRPFSLGLNLTLRCKARKTAASPNSKSDEAN